MRTYSVSEFRENLASALDLAAEELVIVRRNGAEFEIRPRNPVAKSKMRSGLDVPAISSDIPASLDSILDDIQMGRQRA
jgi:hypothetical protein